MSYFDDEAIFTHRWSLVQTIQHIFSQLAPKLLWNCLSWLNYGEKNECDDWTKDFLVGNRQTKNFFFFWSLCCNAFFSMRSNLKMRLLCITWFHLLLCSWLQAMVRASPQGKKCTTCYKQITANLYQQYTQMDELCAVWVRTDEWLKW